VTVGGREGESGAGREVERWNSSAKMYWRALYWPDYVVLTVLTTSLSVEPQRSLGCQVSLAAGLRSLCQGHRECRRRTPP
jgi:hypothetical protein